MMWFHDALDQHYDSDVTECLVVCISYRVKVVAYSLSV